MGEIGLIVVLYAVAMLLLVAEIFIPSHGVLTIAGLAFLVVAVVKTFSLSTQGGVVAVAACVVLLPATAILAVKIWPHTPMGRVISPDNPVAGARDVGVDVMTLQAMIGSAGRSLTPLRPAGTCVFGERRFSCVAEMGMISQGVDVQVVGVRGSNLVVRPGTPPTQA